MIAHTETVVAPYYGRAACAATGGDPRTAFSIFLSVTAFRSEPIVMRRGCGESAGCWGKGTAREAWVFVVSGCQQSLIGESSIRVKSRFENTC